MAKKTLREIHAYLSPDEFRLLKALADKQCRSVTAQIRYLVQKAVAEARP